MKSWMSRTMVMVPILLALAAGPAIVGATTAGASLPSSVSYGTGSQVEWSLPYSMFRTVNLSGKHSGSLTTTSGTYAGSVVTAATQPVYTSGTISVSFTGQIKVTHSGTTITGVSIEDPSFVYGPGSALTGCKITWPAFTFGKTRKHGDWASNTNPATAATVTGTCQDKALLSTYVSRSGYLNAALFAS
jgi:hypothetical protein